jgi:hypothetical protein
MRAACKHAALCTAPQRQKKLCLRSNNQSTNLADVRPLGEQFTPTGLHSEPECKNNII